MVIAGVDPPIVLLVPPKVKFPLIKLDNVPLTTKSPSIPIFFLLLSKNQHPMLHSSKSRTFLILSYFILSYMIL